MFQKCPICKSKGVLKNNEQCPTCSGERIIHKENGLPPSKQWNAPYIPIYPSYPVYPQNPYPWCPTYPIITYQGTTVGVSLDPYILYY